LYVQQTDYIPTWLTNVCLSIGQMCERRT